MWASLKIWTWRMQRRKKSVIFKQKHYSSIGQERRVEDKTAFIKWNMRTQTMREEKPEQRVPQKIPTSDRQPHNKKLILQIHPPMNTATATAVSQGCWVPTQSGSWSWHYFVALVFTGMKRFKIQGRGYRVLFPSFWVPLRPGTVRKVGVLAKRPLGCYVELWR